VNHPKDGPTFLDSFNAVEHEQTTLARQDAAITVCTMSTVQEIEQAALKLPRKTRVALAERLMESSVTKREKEISALWADEAERRIVAYEAGKMKSVPAEVVFKYRGRAPR
jgi:putative addiction module component (TIGR02574 family)